MRLKAGRTLYVSGWVLPPAAELAGLRSHVMVIATAESGQTFYFESEAAHERKDVADHLTDFGRRTCQPQRLRVEPGDRRLAARELSGHGRHRLRRLRLPSVAGAADGSGRKLRSDEAMALVSVVVPAYRHARFIGEALASVYRQTHLELELIVIDDRSPDETFELCKALLATPDYSGRFKRVVCQQNETNLGAHNTINVGLGLARGR